MAALRGGYVSGISAVHKAEVGGEAGQCLF